MARNNLSFAVKNDDALKTLLDKASPKRAEDALRQAAVAGARVFFDEIMLRVPRGTLPLPQGSSKRLWETLLITYLPENSVTGKRASYAVTFSAQGWYARLVEFGHSSWPGKPFIRPSYEAKKGEAAQVVITKLKGSFLNGE